MPTLEERYRAVISQQEEQLLPFLRAFEALQEQMYLAKVKQHNHDLVDNVV